MSLQQKCEDGATLYSLSLSHLLYMWQQPAFVVYGIIMGRQVKDYLLSCKPDPHVGGDGLVTVNYKSVYGNLVL